MATPPAFADKRLLELLVDMNLLDREDKYAIIESQYDALIVNYAQAVAGQNPPPVLPAGFTPQDFVNRKYTVAADGTKKPRPEAMEYAAFDAMDDLKKSAVPDAVKGAVKVPFIGQFAEARLTEKHKLDGAHATRVAELAAAFQGGAQVSGVLQALAAGQDPSTLPYAVKFDGVPNDRRVDDARDPLAQQFQATVSMLCFLAKAAELKPELKPQVQGMAQQLTALGTLQQRAALAGLSQEPGMAKRVEWLERYFPPVAANEVEGVQTQIAQMQAGIAQAAVGVMQSIKDDAALKDKLPAGLKDKLPELEAWVGKRAGQAAQMPGISASNRSPARNFLERAWHGFVDTAKHAFFHVDEKTDRITGISPQGVLTFGGAAVAIGGLVSGRGNERHPHGGSNITKAGTMAVIAGTVDGIIRSRNHDNTGGMIDALISLARQAPEQELPGNGQAPAASR